MAIELTLRLLALGTTLAQMPFTMASQVVLQSWGQSPLGDIAADGARALPAGGLGLGGSFDSTDFLSDMVDHAPSVQVDDAGRAFVVAPYSLTGLHVWAFDISGLMPVLLWTRTLAGDWRFSSQLGDFQACSDFLVFLAQDPILENPSVVSLFAWSKTTGAEVWRRNLVLSGNAPTPATVGFITFPSWPALYVYWSNLEIDPQKAPTASNATWTAVAVASGATLWQKDIVAAVAQGELDKFPGTAPPNFTPYSTLIPLLLRSGTVLFCGPYGLSTATGAIVFKPDIPANVPCNTINGVAMNAVLVDGASSIVLWFTQSEDATFIKVSLTGTLLTRLPYKLEWFPQRAWDMSVGLVAPAAGEIIVFYFSMTGGSSLELLTSVSQDLALGSVRKNVAVAAWRTSSVCVWPSGDVPSGQISGDPRLVGVSADGRVFVQCEQTPTPRLVTVSPTSQSTKVLWKASCSPAEYIIGVDGAVLLLAECDEKGGGLSSLLGASGGTDWKAVVTICSTVVIGLLTVYSWFCRKESADEGCDLFQTAILAFSLLNALLAVLAQSAALEPLGSLLALQHLPPHEFVSKYVEEAIPCSGTAYSPTYHTEYPQCFRWPTQSSVYPWQCGADFPGVCSNMRGVSGLPVSATCGMCESVLFSPPDCQCDYSTSGNCTAKFTPAGGTSQPTAVLESVLFCSSELASAVHLLSTALAIFVASNVLKVVQALPPVKKAMSNKSKCKVMMSVLSVVVSIVISILIVIAAGKQSGTSSYACQRALPSNCRFTAAYTSQNLMGRLAQAVGIAIAVFAPNPVVEFMYGLRCCQHGL